MKKLINYFAPFFILILFLFLNSCSSGCTCSISAEDEAYFKDQIAASQDSINSGNISAYANRYTENSILMVPHGEELKGKEAIAEWLNSFPEMTAEFGFTEAFGSCQLATVRGTYALTLADGNSLDQGKWLEIWQKNVDGNWELTHDIFNSNIPMPVQEASDDETGEEEAE